jgi:uncharacterized protein YjdB
MTQIFSSAFYKVKDWMRETMKPKNPPKAKAVPPKPTLERHQETVIELLEKIIRNQKIAYNLQQELNTYILEILGEIRDINTIEKDQTALLNQIIGILVPTASYATLTIEDSKGNILMPATLAVGSTATAVLHEFVSQGGAELAPLGPVSYTSSDATIATVDPASGLVTAVAAGVATITGTDSGNSLTASDTVSDTPVVATFATLVITPN